MSGFHSEGTTRNRNAVAQVSGSLGCNSGQYADRINADQWRASLTAERTTMLREHSCRIAAYS
jgi:hypothetical protein